MNVPEQSSHNANLPVTIAKNGRIVNPIIHGVIEEDYTDTIINQALEPVYDNWDTLTRETQASILFIKVSNNIFKFNLKPKVIELYIVLAYIIVSKPKFRFSYRAIAKEYEVITSRVINKDTVAKYVQELEANNLLKKGENKNYIIGTELELGSDFQDIACNIYQIPKANYTPFYIKIYLDKLTKNEVILDHYIATLPYKNLKPSKVTKEVNISLSSYFKLLRSLRLKSIIYRHYLINNNLRYKRMYYYYSTKRTHLKKDYEDDKITRWYDKRDEVLESINKPKKHHSKYWFTGKMGEYMKKYGIKYISLFDNYNIQDALDIIKELETQIGKSTMPYKLTAPLIVKAIKEGWNWDKIIERRHNEFKKALC